MTNDSRASSADADLSAVGVIAATLLAAYGAVLGAAFGVLDDYTFLAEGMRHGNATYNLLLGAGRPLNALALNAAFASAGSVEGLTVLRHLTLLGMLLLGWAIYRIARCAQAGMVTALALACGTLLLPSFHVYASWAQHFTTPYAALAAVVAAALIVPSGRLYSRSRMSALLLSLLLLVSAMLTYQPVAMMFCAVVVMSMMLEGDFSTRWTVGRVLAAIGVLAVATAIAYVIFRFGRAGVGVGTGGRYGLVTDLSGKLAWFFREPLRNAFALFGYGNLSVVRGVIAVCVVGFVLYFRRNGLRTGITLLLLAVLALPGTYLPNLATAENWGSYRTIGALSMLALVLFVLCAREICIAAARLAPATWSARWLARIGAVAAACMLTLLAVRASDEVRKGFVSPNVAEIDNLAALLVREAGARPDAQLLAVAHSDWTDSRAPYRAYDEFGMHSSLRPVYADAIVRIVTAGMGLFPHARIVARDRLAEQAPGIGVQDVVEVDFHQLVNSQAYRADPVEVELLRLPGVVAADISDDNWQRGVWRNAQYPGALSFVMRARGGQPQLATGQKLIFPFSGERKVVKVEAAGKFLNVLVDGAPLDPRDGYPAVISIGSD